MAPVVAPARPAPAAPPLMMMCAARSSGVRVARGVDLWPSELTMTVLNGQLGDIYQG